MPLLCDFCGGDTDSKLKCKEYDCGADMAEHYDLVLPYDSPIRDMFLAANAKELVNNS